MFTLHICNTIPPEQISTDYKKLCVQVLKKLSYCRETAAECVSFGHNRKNETGIRYFADIVGLSSTTVT